MTEVAPYVGAWIETNPNQQFVVLYASHPTWVRGLKQQKAVTANLKQKVAPYVGAWIETNQLSLKNLKRKVAPYVGAWIEIR